MGHFLDDLLEVLCDTLEVAIEVGELLECIIDENITL